MSSEHSVSEFISGLKSGNERASQKIWERFYERLLVHADRKLKSSPRKAMNEEDVVQKAFADFFLQVKSGRFPKLDDRNDLWQILAMLVDRRAKDQIRFQNTQKAGGGRVNTESFLDANAPSAMDNGLAQIQDNLPSPEMALEFIEAVDGRLGELQSDEHRKIALLKLQGFANREIADQIGSSERTVERCLNAIRKKWEKVGDDNGS
ncbi:MAG: ECF-type sigma factor [Pirellulaceae bacterium]